MSAIVTAIADGVGGFVIDMIEVAPPGSGEVRMRLRAEQPGGHEWAYWLRMIEASLRFFGTILIERR